MAARVEPATGPQISIQESEQLLRDLVSIPSPSGQEAEAAQFLVDWMGKHGFQAYVDDSGSAVGTLGGEGEDIVLLGHIDTVPGELPVRLCRRAIYGRGSVDAKGALAAFVAAARGIEPAKGRRIVIVGATQEETGASLGARHALRQFHPKACIVGEPSGWERITLGYKGQLLIDWNYCGALTHAASPIPSIAERAVEYWLRIQNYVSEDHVQQSRAFDRLDVSLRELNTRQVGAYGQAGMQIEFRLPPDLDPYPLMMRLHQMADGGEVRFMGHVGAFVAPKNSTVARAMVRSVRLLGGKPRFVYKSGTSDMNLVGPVWECPILAYGPGDSRLDHTPQEHIDLDEFQRSVGVLRAALQDLLRGG